MPTFTYTGRNVESMKGGVLMKSKRRTYGKKIALCSFGNYHFNVNIPHKSTIAALCYRSAIER